MSTDWMGGKAEEKAAKAHSEKELPKKNGGARPGAGRKKGVPNKRTAETIAKVEASGVTPLEVMLKNMRKRMPRGASPSEKAAHLAFVQQAARDAAPYVHARLSSVQVSGGLKLNHESALDELE
jgi:hypothetical protein